jgi:hypothetical protein
MKHRLLIVAALTILSFLAGSVSTQAAAAPSACASGNVTVGIGSVLNIPYPPVKVGDTVTVTLTWSGPVEFLTMEDGAGIGSSIGGPSPLTSTVTIVAGPNDFFTINNPRPAVQAFHYTVTVNGGCGGPGGGDDVTFWDFDDGRINSHDGAETAAVYCEDDGGVTIFSVVNSVGKLAFKVSADEMDALPDHPEHNTLIKSGSGISLYELTTGELQINAPDNYVFIWDGCSA